MESVQQSGERQVTNDSCRSIVAISEHPQRAALLDALLIDANSYDVIFVESISGGYSRIKQAAPDLVVVFLDVDDAAACQLLTMLTTDGDTCAIPVVTWVTTRVDNELEDIMADVDDVESPYQHAAIHMN